ncbi:MAG: restriction endonuclease subunit S [Rhodocyclaceae bacterium]|nr:restriction endonuclease subunit S [Rhodocyclaceae bacterium]
MKAGWEVKSLAEVCQIKPPKAEARLRITGTELVSFVPMEALGIDQKFLVPMQTKPLEDVSGSYTYFADGDVLLAKITPCFENGKLGIADTLMNSIGFGSSEYIVFRPSPELDKEWLYYFLSRQSFREEGATQMSGAVGHKRVSKEFIESYPIPIPHLPEQHRIVALLDEAFAGIATAKANAEKNLQNARALFESHLQSVFTERGEGWVDKPIGDLCQRLHQGLNTAGEKIKFVETGYPIIQTRNIDEGVVDLDNKMKFMSEDDWHLYREKYRPEIGDVFFTNIGTIGKMAIVTEERDYLIHWNIFKLRPRFDLISSAYLRYALEQLTLSGYFKRMQKGGTVDFVTKKMISEATLPLPSMATQAEIVRQLDAVREEAQNLEAIYLHKLETLDELKQSLLHQAFSGAL